MRLADLRPCDGCGGPLFSPPVGRWFQVVRTSGALLSPLALDVVRAAARQGVPLERLEADRHGDAVAVLGDNDPRQVQELLLCTDCYHSRPIAELVRRRLERIEDLVAHGSVS